VLVDTLYLQMPRLQVQHYAIPLCTAAPLIVYNRLHIHVQAVKVTWPYISTCGLVIRGCVLVDTLYLQMPRLQVQHYAIPLCTVAISISHVSCSTATAEGPNVIQVQSY
jgi:hypothetical protein